MRKERVLQIAIRLSLALFFIAHAIAPRVARANDEEAAIDLVRHIIQAARESLPSAPILRTGFNTVAIARSILGEHWTSASESERSRFLDALRSAIADNVVRRFKDEHNDLIVLRSQTLSSGDIIVFTRLKSELNGIVPVDWRVRRYETELYVVDLRVNGASIAIARRDQYDVWLRTSGGSITGLIPIMQLPQMP